jgi:uncharacterized protein with ATP-grasp and redox domains
MEVASTKLDATVDERCKSCFHNTYQRLFEKFNVGIAQRQAFGTFYKETLLNYNHHSSPEIQRELNSGFCRIINISDPFEEEKINSNAHAKELYKEWKPAVLSSPDPFYLALRLAIAGNIMDYGANNSFDIHQTVTAVINASLAIDHSKLLKKRIKEAERILYLGDNAGEIVFDKLLIEIMMHKEITYAVKAGPVLNDATITDVKEVGMDWVADIVSNGYDAPSTVLHKCSKEFLEIYNSADLIISKGQGNFEGLMHQNDSRIFFLLMAKCDVIGEILNVEKGSFIVYNQSGKLHGK